MTEFFSILITAAILNNIVLVQQLGISSLFAFSPRLQTAADMAIASFPVMVLSTIINLTLLRLVLVPLNLQALALVLFVLVSAGIVTLLAATVSKALPLAWHRHGLELLLLSGNSAIIGLALSTTLTAAPIPVLLASIFGSALGFSVLLLLFAAFNERLQLLPIPPAFAGMPIRLISAGIVSLCLLSMSGAA